MGSFDVNELGLYDLGGNAWERCSDSTPDPNIGVFRGGGWADDGEERILSSERLFYTNGRSSDGGAGFRVVLERSSTGSTSVSLPRPANPIGGSVTKDKPYQNSLGMRFVPVPITGGRADGKEILFSIWETRVGDYEAFIKQNRGREWPKPRFKQKKDEPAVMVSWDDAVAFCAWLTEKRRKGSTRYRQGDVYRLPTDHEWSCAVGIGKKENAKDLISLRNIFPWGEGMPPNEGGGNYYGEETKQNPIAKRNQIETYNDGFDRTSTVGSFESNEFGLFDMGGNVWEWCDDKQKGKGLLRGGSIFTYQPHELLSTFRLRGYHNGKDEFGFRIVLVRGAAK